MMFGKKVLVAEDHPNGDGFRSIMLGVAIAPSAFGKILVQVEHLVMTVQPEDIFFPNISNPDSWITDILDKNMKILGLYDECDSEEEHSDKWDNVAAQTMGSTFAKRYYEGEFV